MRLSSETCKASRGQGRLGEGPQMKLHTMAVLAAESTKANMIQTQAPTIWTYDLRINLRVIVLRRPRHNQREFHVRLP